MKEWLRETHGPGFELLRHFLRRFFESEMITAPGQMTAAWIGALPVFFQWFFLFVSPLRHKYEYFSQLASPVPYREAVRADELWLITLTMSATGLFTAMKWRFIFPDLRDYRASEPCHCARAMFLVRNWWLCSPSPPPPWSL